MRKFVWIFTVVVVLAFAGQALAADGASVFASKCSPCHGKDAKGSVMAPGLAGSDFIKGDEAPIKDTVKNGRSGDQKKYKNFPLAMPKWDGQLKAEEIDAVVAYLKGLK